MITVFAGYVVRAKGRYKPVEEIHRAQTVYLVKHRIGRPDSYIDVGRIKLPKYYIGRRIKLKVEIVE